MNHFGAFIILTGIVGAFITEDVSAFNPILAPYVAFRPASLHGHQLSATKSRSMPDAAVEDEEGVTVVKAKNIERDWNVGDYKADGAFTADVIIPDGEVKGCAFFMHGFSQFPKAYMKTLKRVSDNANIAIIAVETGVTSDIVRNGEDKPEEKDSKQWLQLCLQRAVSEDTKQCIRMVLDGDEAFSEYNIGNSVPLGVCGHSMGGGLCFSLVSDPEFHDIDYVFTMAPAYGEKEYDPITAVKARTVENSMLLAGSLDFVARADAIKEISATSNAKGGRSSIYVEIKRGIHTGFEDKLVLFNISLGTVLTVISFLTSFVEPLILKGLQFLRTNTGQLEGSELLMTFFFQKMVEGKKVTLEDADKYLEDNIKGRWDDKFQFEYPSK